MTNKTKVAVAMSGGVDSSIAASLLKEAGYEVYGVHMALYQDPDSEHRFSTLEETCRFLDIPLHNLDFEPEFQDKVIDYFCREYSIGRTPNPCIACNRHIKFALLLNRVLGMGFQYLATGHYARVRSSFGGFSLLKGIDSSKDQSYFLYGLGQHELRHLLLPLGNRRKAEIKRLAKKRGLPTSDVPESQDICFLRGKDYRSFISQYVELKSGDIVDTENRILGKHDGLALYTVGQRQGLGLGSKQRYYVIKLDASNNRLVVGHEDKLMGGTLTAGEINWIADRIPKRTSALTAKIRYQSTEAGVGFLIRDSQLEVTFDEPQKAIAAGQAIVFYKGDIVLGGGIIEG